MKKVTAGYDELGTIAPLFAHLNDDILFGEVWSRESQLALRERSIVTVTALMASGILDASLKFHIQCAKENGVSRDEMAEILTQAAFYAGWPKAWAALRMMKEVYGCEQDAGIHHDFKQPIFEIGEKNDTYANHFIGQSYLKMLNTKGVSIAHVTFEPGCRNDWHIHHGGGQILFITQGSGWYQEAGKQAVLLQPGDVVYIAPEVKHWHGAVCDHWFSHLAIEIPSKHASTTWLEKVEDEHYRNL